MLFLQVDGLGHDVVRRTVRDGDMPTLARWLAEGGHELTGWHCDWSSQTGASVCGILHGDNTDILGFRWYEKDRDHVMACAHPGDAAEIERRHSDGRGLLAVDGAARGNLFTGDAEHVSLTMSAIPLVEKRRRRGRGHERLWAGYYTYFANPVNALRTFVASLVDVGRELLAAARQRRADVRPRTRRGGWYPLARPGTTVISRDIVVSAIIEDMMAGRSVVYADFLGYDEVAHHSGIERFDTLEVLRGIDRQIGRLHRATHLAPRPYRIVVLTDHGQTQGWAFADRFGESIEQFVGRQCGAPQGSPRTGTTRGGPPRAGRPVRCSRRRRRAPGRSRAGCGRASSGRAPPSTAPAPRAGARARSRGRRPASWSWRRGTSRWCRSPNTTDASSWRRSSASSPPCCPRSSTIPAWGSCWCAAGSTGPSCWAATARGGSRPTRSRAPTRSRPTVRTPPTWSAASTASRTAPTS
ncbi:hypothetical protein ACFQV8_29455 [Pseudonocardia benzenivorans]